MLDRPWRLISGNLSSIRSQDIYETCGTKAFCLVNKGVLCREKFEDDLLDEWDHGWGNCLIAVL